MQRIKNHLTLCTALLFAVFLVTVWLLFTTAVSLCLSVSRHTSTRRLLVQCVSNELGAATGQSIGDVRLVGGSTDWEGRVEVLYNIYYLFGVIPVASWGTVCDDLWDTADTQVVCRQLGHHSTGKTRLLLSHSGTSMLSPLLSTAGSTAYSLAYFGQGSGTIYLDNVACTGSESRLIDCSYDSDTTDCGHHEDAGVRCLPCRSIVQRGRMG